MMGVVGLIRIGVDDVGSVILNFEIVAPVSVFVSHRMVISPRCMLSRSSGSPF